MLNRNIYCHTNMVPVFRRAQAVLLTSNSLRTSDFCHLLENEGSPRERLKGQADGSPADCDLHTVSLFRLWPESMLTTQGSGRNMCRNHLNKFHLLSSALSAWSSRKNIEIILKMWAINESLSESRVFFQSLWSLWSFFSLSINTIYISQ